MYCISLRSLLMLELRDLLLKVVINYVVTNANCYYKRFVVSSKSRQAYLENKKYAKDIGK